MPQFTRNLSAPELLLTERTTAAGNSGGTHAVCERSAADGADDKPRDCAVGRAAAGCRAAANCGEDSRTDAAGQWGRRRRGRAADRRPHIVLQLWLGRSRAPAAGHVRLAVQSRLGQQGVRHRIAGARDPGRRARLRRSGGEICHRAEGDDISRVTIGHLATQTSGLLFRQDYPPWPDEHYTQAAIFPRAE